MYVNVISDHQAIIKRSSSDHTTTKANSRTLLKTTSVFFFICYSQWYVSPHSQKSFFEKNLKLQMLQWIFKRSSSDHQAIIQLQKQFLELCSKQLLFFFHLLFTMICFPTFSKKFFWKKFKIANVTMDIQAIIKRSSNYYIFNLICKMKNVKCKMNNLKFKI